ncbi:MAG: hypothetical protein SWK76_09185, partial [Actinomycetota bacterium]|nr:hypothetical protein [Actinomycetota bacterium]
VERRAAWESEDEPPGERPYRCSRSCAGGALVGGDPGASRAPVRCVVEWARGLGRAFTCAVERLRPALRGRGPRVAAWCGGY